MSFAVKKTSSEFAATSTSFHRTRTCRFRRGGFQTRPYRPDLSAAAHCRGGFQTRPYETDRSEAAEVRADTRKVCPYATPRVSPGNRPQFLQNGISTGFLSLSSSAADAAAKSCISNGTSSLLVNRVNWSSLSFKRSKKRPFVHSIGVGRATAAR